jgi:hypothetical protein
MLSTRDMIIAAAGIYIIAYKMKSDRERMFVALIVAGLIYIGPLRPISMRLWSFEGLDGQSPDEGVPDDGVDDSGFVSSDSGSVSGDGGASTATEKPDKVKAGTLNAGPYDGLCLKTGNTEYWMKTPDESALVPNDGLYTYLSSQGPIKMKLSDQAALIGPPVDGVDGSVEKMFMFANNVSSPLCCPSTFTTSTGCVCTTKNQRDFVAARGLLDGGEAATEDYL